MSAFPMRNLYPATTRPQVSAPPLVGAVKADAVIVGGGYTGLSTALHLTEAGLTPVVLEAAEIGHGCSGRNGGQVNPGLKLLPDDVEAHWGRDLGARMVALSYQATGDVFDLIERHGIDCAPRRSGTIRAAIDAAGVAQVRSLVEQCRRRGGAVHLLDADQMKAATGASIYLAGALDERGGHVNPLAYARGLALAAQRGGAALHGESPALAITRDGRDWRVTTPKGSVTAPELVIATNGYTGDLWPGLRRTIAPVYTYITATDPLPADLRATIMPSGAALYEAAWDVIYYRLDDEGRLLMGGRGAQRDARGIADYGHLSAYARKLWPQLTGTAFPWHWHGQVAITEDHFPHLTAPEAGVHLMLGYNGRGLAMATVAGRLVAARIASGGKTAIDLPVREKLEPMPFHRFWRLGAEATMAWNRLKDGIRGR